MDFLTCTIFYSRNFRWCSPQSCTRRKNCNILQKVCTLVSGKSGVLMSTLRGTGSLYQPPSVLFTRSSIVNWVFAANSDSLSMWMLRTSSTNFVGGGTQRDRNGQTWICCSQCHMWAHDVCDATLDQVRSKKKNVCSLFIIFIRSTFI